MGRAKEYLLQQMEQGWSSVGDKWVCGKCFHDASIRAFIRDNADTKRCSYCKRRSRNEIAAHMDEVLEFMAAGIRSEYDDAVNSVHYESAEGGYTLGTMDSWELLEDIGLEIEEESLLSDLRDAFWETRWVQRDPYALRHCDALQYSWEEFCTLVKHRIRFVFFRLETTDHGNGELEPQQFLDSLSGAVTQAGLLRDIPAGTKWFRAHEHAPDDILSGAGRLGPPPPHLASHSRMSPAGISMLYVAKDAETAIAEVKTKSPSLVHTVAEFKNLRPLRILDLSSIEMISSLFDPELRNLRMPLTFLNGFATDISKRISDTEKSYEYVPTQVMTEYFRHVFVEIPDLFNCGDNSTNIQSFEKVQDLLDRKIEVPSSKIDGIAFRSSKKQGGVNYTLFVEPEMCADSRYPGAIMLLQKVEVL